MKVYTSLNGKFKNKKKLISDNGDVKFNNVKDRISTKGMKLSSQKWINRQLSDPFVNAAKIEGYLARSAYKLLEINNKYNIFNNQNDIIIDLGCSPGSWVQVISTNKNTYHSHIIGVDLLPIKFSCKNLHFIQGNFEDKNVQKQIVEKIITLSKNNKQQYQKADCILCDIAPNNTGDAENDRMNSERIVEEVLKFAEKYLNNNGNLVCKTIKGADQLTFPIIKKNFKKAFRFKPKSSRKDSSEIFIVGMNKNN